MKVVLYMAITPNGFVAKENDDTSWVSEVEWNSFRGMINHAGNMIIGRRTYEIMREANQFAGLEKIKVMVITSKKLKDADRDIVFVKNPREALDVLEKQKFKEALVCGGGKLNGGFMKENLVDELYLDVEPTIFGNGIPLFGNADFEAKLELLGTKKLSKEEIQLHYHVIR